MSRVDMHAALLDTPAAIPETCARAAELDNSTEGLLNSLAISQNAYYTNHASLVGASPGFVSQAQLRRNRRKAAALHDRLDNVCPLGIQELLASGHCASSIPLRPLSCC